MTVLRHNDTYVNVHLKPLALEDTKGLPHVLYKLSCSAPVRKVGANRYVKEAIHVGQFEKEACPFNAGADISWEVTSDLIDYWVTTGAKMRTAGIETHIFDDHKETTDKGQILDMFKDKNEDGKDALFLVMEFDDDTEAHALDDVDVSIMADPDYEGYTYPVRHVCLTKDPVVQGLEKFKTVIAASLPTPDPGEDPMLKALAKKMGLTVPDDADDAAISELIAKAYAAKSAPAGPPKIAASKVARDLNLFDATEDDDDAAMEAIRKAVNPEKVTVAASSVRVQKDNRAMRLDALSSGDNPVLTPATSKALKDIFCEDEKVTLALSREDGAGIKDPDGFEAMVLALSTNGSIVKPGEKTPAQVPAKDNLLVKAMGTEAGIGNNF